MTVRNVHERTIDASAEVVGEMFDRLGGHEDRLWPSPAWPAMRLDRPLQVGADGGHGPIRYEVSAYEPGPCRPTCHVVAVGTALATGRSAAHGAVSPR